MSQKKILKILGSCVAPPPTHPAPLWKTQLFRRPTVRRFLTTSDRFRFPTPSDPVIVSCQYVMSSCHVIVSYSQTNIHTNLIRIHLDNIYVNKLTNKLVVEQHLASINNTNGNCASRGVG